MSNEAKKKMLALGSHDALSNKFTCYVRSLEQLAVEVEDQLLMLEEFPDPAAIKIATTKIRAHLDKIHAQAHDKETR